MRHKLKSILIIMLLIFASIQIINLNELTTLAYSDDEEFESNNYLDFGYMWNITSYLANIIHDDSVYGLGEIKKGRYFGSDGDLATSVHLNISFVVDCGFNESDVRKVKLENINDSDFDYTEFVEVDAYRLTINHPDFLTVTNLSYNTIPQDDCYPIVAVRRNLTGQWFNYTMDTNFHNVRVHNEINFSQLFSRWKTGLSPFNITYTSLNDYGFILGNVTYIASGQEIPVHEYHTVFLLDEGEDVESQIQNATNASGIILLQNNSQSSRFQNAINYNLPIIRVDITDQANKQNITNVTRLLENRSIIIADNSSYANKITFIHNLSSSACGPDDDFIILYNFSDTPFGISAKCTFQYVLNLLRSIFCKGICKGIIINDDLTENCHNMFPQFIKNPRFYSNVDPLFALPGFSVNNTIGSFLWNHGDDDSNTISGYVNQTHHQETAQHPGVEAYNVEADLHIDKSPYDAVVILSSRYDSMWGECPGDSGSGNGIMMGTAKYMQQLNKTGIKPKYNVTFLLTTNEENTYYGAQFYSDSHPDDNIIMWIGTDQLGFKNGSLHNVYKNSTHRNITENISKILDYEEKTGYEMLHNTTKEIGKSYTKTGLFGRIGCGAEDVVFHDRGNCDTILIHKDNIWPFHHRRGLNLTEGDVLNSSFFDRKDVNMFYNITWATVKYFLYNPDCWFNSITYESVDTDHDTIMNSIKATLNVTSILPNDKIMIKADLVDASSENIVNSTWVNYTVDRTGVERNIILGMPIDVNEGDYYLTLEVYNSTGRINQIVGLDYNANDTETSPTYHLNQYYTVGDIRIGTVSSNAQNIILASRFTVTEDAYAQNMTAYVYGATLYQQPKQTYQCMIYQASDLQLIGSTNQVVCGDTGWVTFPFDQKPLIRKNVQYYLSIWGENTTSVYGTSQSIANGYHNNSYTFGDPPQTIEWDMGISLRQYSIFCNYLLEPYLPEITNVSHYPDIVGFGEQVTVEADVMDNLSGVDYVTVNITNPDNVSENHTMIHTNGNTYQYDFTDTWLVGQYNCTIWAYDNSSNGNSSTGQHFHVSANATITVQTLQDTYYSDEYVNLTDPPGDGGENTIDYFGDINVPESMHLIITEDTNMITVDTRDGLVWKFHKEQNGYNEVWHNGTRLINQEQWTLQHQYNNEWTNLGTPTQIIVEQPEPYHAVVKRFYSNHMGTDFAISYEFYGQSRTKITFEGMIGEINNYRLHWSTSGINTNFAESTTNDHYTRIWNTGEQDFVFDYSDVYRTLGDITSVETQNTQDGYTVDQTFNLGLLAPGYYTLDPTFGYTSQGGSGLSIGNSIRGSWFTCPTNGVATNIRAYITHTGLGGGSTNGKCAIYRYNADNDATDLIGETNQISLSGSGWRTFTFTNGPRFTAGTKYFLVAWASTQTLIIDTLAYTTETAKGIAKTSTTYGTWPDPLTGETGVDHKYSIYCTYNASPVISNPYPANGSGNVSRYPTMHVYVNDSEGENMNITFSSNTSSTWGSFGTIVCGSNNEFGYHHVGETTDTVDDQIRGTWFTCPANSTAYSISIYSHPDPGGNPQQRNYMKAALYYMSNNTKLAETIENGYWGLLDPDPYPAWLEFTFPTPPTLRAGEEYYAVVWGDSPHTFYYSDLSDFNRSIYVNRTYGSWPSTLTFVNYTCGKTYDIFVKYSTTSTSNGTYYMDNFDMNNAFTRYFWNVSSTDGKSTTNSGIYHFRTSGNQSKINNTGTTNITGYLLMQVQFYNITQSTWIVADDTINETTPRTILVGQQLALDHIFNGLVTTSDLLNEFGSGTYRVYAAFRDPNGDVLICSDETDLEAVWEFIIT